MKLAKFYYVLALLIGIALAGVTYHSALAQCVDTVTAPCPPEKEKKTPVPVVPVSTATSTPLPITGPTEDTAPAKAEWSGTCGDTTCIGQFTNGCKSVGGTVETGEIKDGKVPLTCKVPLVIEPTAMLVAAVSTATQLPSEANKPAPTREPGPPPFFDVNGDLASNVPEWAAERFPWLGWGILIGILAVLSVQGVRKYMANANKDDDEVAMQLRAKRAEIPANNQDEDEAMQLRSKRAEIPTNNQDGTEGFHRFLGDSDGDAPPPPPPPPPPAKK